MIKKTLLLVILLVFLTGCVGPGENTVPSSSTSAVHPTTPETIPPPVDPVIENIYSSTRTDLLVRMEQNESTTMLNEVFLHSVLCDDYLDESYVRIYEAVHSNYRDLDGRYTGIETITIRAHLGCACKNPKDCLSDAGKTHSSLDIRFFYNQGGCDSLLDRSTYEKMDSYTNVYCYSSSDGAVMHYLVLLSSNYACRFSVDTSYRECDRVAEKLISYVLDLSAGVS